MTAVEATAEKLTDDGRREWVRDHRVCWETLIHRELGPQGVAPVGYDILLSARCVGPGPWDAGGPGAREVFTGLRELAEAVIPCDCAEDIRIAPFRPAFQLRPESDWVPEVRLRIEIRHDHDYFAAIDDEERTCVRRLERALEAWGAHPDAWPRGSGARS